MNSNWQRSETIFSIGFDIIDPELIEVKEWFGSKWSNKYNLPPHVGLLLLPFKEENTNEAFAISEKFVRSWDGNIKSKITEIVFEPKTNGDVFVNLKLEELWLKSQHDHLLKMLEPLRFKGLVRVNDYERINNGSYNQDELRLLYENGFVFSGANYKPHITLGQLSASDYSDITETEIRRQCAHLINYSVKLNQPHILFHTDSNLQGETKILKRINLSL